MTLVQAFLVAPAQFLEQMLQMGGERRFGVHALLQPFTHGVTNGPAGPVIELLKVPIDTAIHVLVSWRVGTRRVPLRHVEWLSNVKSTTAKFVSGRNAIVRSLASQWNNVTVPGTKKPRRERPGRRSQGRSDRDQ